MISNICAESLSATYLTFSAVSKYAGVTLFQLSYACLLYTSKELAEKGFLTSSCCPAFVSYIEKAFPKLTDMIYNTDGIYFDKKGEQETMYNSIFRDGNVLLATGWLMHTDAFRAVNFG